LGFSPWASFKPNNSFTGAKQAAEKVLNEGHGFTRAINQMRKHGFSPHFSPGGAKRGDPRLEKDWKGRSLMA
jgi:hypothetical protein